MADNLLDSKTIQYIERVLKEDKTAIVKPTRDGIKVFKEHRILIKENNPRK